MALYDTITNKMHNIVIYNCIVNALKLRHIAII